MEYYLNSFFHLFLIFIIELLLLFFATRWFTTQLFYFFYKFTKNNTLVYLLVSAIYLPGTIVHELAHYFLAIILFLPVKYMEIFPKIEKGYIKLGSVVYVKRDVIRGFIVGIAPVFAGLTTIYLLFSSGFTISQNILIKILVWYLIFVISSTMFSSPQDMVDAIFAIPILIIISLIAFILQVDKILLSWLNNIATIVFLRQLTYYLFIILMLYGTLFIIKIIRSKK